MAARLASLAAAAATRQAGGGLLFRRAQLSSLRSNDHRFGVTGVRAYAQAASDSEKSYERPSAELHQEVTQEEKDQFARELRTQSLKTPWHREGSDQPPVARERSAGAMTKGKLLTTPTRLFKLILPLTTADHNSDRKDAQPLALLMHPSQPLSYLERLIQAELPLLRDRVPNVDFRAEDSTADDAEAAGTSKEREKAEDLDEAQRKKLREERERKREEERSAHSDPTSDAARKLRGGPGAGGVETYSGLGRESDRPARAFVRWSKSTEIGDFVRDAARGSEFTVEIEGAPGEIRVGVPSFGDRTYYLRLRLRKKARQISRLTDIKHECDRAAHAHSRRLAIGGFMAMVGWGAGVAWLTFFTKYGWDTMEPVTYLVGLAGILGGYGYFIFANKDVSYRSAMNITISRRQHRLYEEKGFDLQRYNDLIDEGNTLRREIMAIANEYDVDWDERKDAQDDKVVEALKEHRKKKKKEKSKDDDDDDDEDDED